jgi:alkanesulfonate monooxygenase SsuD/methylene tetrahydromethanopterin reductase-like flavin-dependent oxidoreductase (luciferase family)
MAKEAARSMAARYAAGTLTPQELQHMAAIEEGWAACGGDLKAFCAKTGINASMVPSIEEALAAGGAQGDVVAATDAVINTLTNSMF